MRVTGVKTFVVGNPEPHRGGFNWVFLKLTTDEGIVGYGEASSMRLKERTAVEMIEELGEAYVIGADPFRIEKLWRELYTGDHAFQHPDLMRLLAVAGVGLLYSFEPQIADELRRGSLRLVLEAYAAAVPGFFLYFPSRAQVSPALRAFVNVARELGRPDRKAS